MKRIMSVILLLLFTTTVLGQDAEIIVIMKDFTTHQGKFSGLHDRTITVTKAGASFSLELDKVMFVIDAVKDVVIYPKELQADERLVNYSEREFEIYRMKAELEEMRQARQEMGGINKSLQGIMAMSAIALIGTAVAGVVLLTDN